MKTNSSDGNIMRNTFNRQSNGVFLRQTQRLPVPNYAQAVNLAQNTSLNAPPLKSMRGRIEDRNLISQHTSVVNIQNTIKRGSVGGQREPQSEQNSLLQHQIQPTNDILQNLTQNQAGDKLLYSNNIHHQRSQSLQKIKNIRDNSFDSPFKKITNTNQSISQNVLQNKGPLSILNSGNIQSASSTQRFNYKDIQDIKNNQYNYTAKLQDIKETMKGTVAGSGLTNNLINSNQIENKYNIDSSKKSNRQFGIIKAYAANTNMGIFRNYNEDRVSIILSISKPFNKQADYWPKTSFFAIYDGHGGANCSDYLRDNLHLFIVRDDYFPQNPTEAIKRGIQYAEQSFIKTAEPNQDRSGSCAIIVMILDDVVYTANVGDSRAIISKNNGQSIENLSVDHKPEDEKERIEAAGGKVYQSIINTQSLVFQGVKINPPHRVFPGKLSVSRTIGDFEAKNSKYGGNPKVIISDPDIVVTKITSDHDFIILGCDGVFDRLNTNEVGKIFWNCAEQFEAAQDIGDTDIHKQCGNALEDIMKETFERKSLDNITLVAVSFDNFANYFQKILDKKQKDSSQRQQISSHSYQVTMPPVQNQNTISSPQTIMNNRGKVNQLHRNINQQTSGQQTYLFPKVSPTNTNESINLFYDDTSSINQGSETFLPSQKAHQHKFYTQQNEQQIPNLQTIPGSQNIQNLYIPSQYNYQNYNNTHNNQYSLNKTSQTSNQNGLVQQQNHSYTNTMPMLNQNQYSSIEQNTIQYKNMPMKEIDQKINKGNQSNSLNSRFPGNKDIEGTYFSKQPRGSTPSTLRRQQQSSQPVLPNTSSNNNLHVENSRLAQQSAQSLQTLKLLQQDKIMQQLQQMHQQQKTLYKKK